jgi:hypothetical protein
MAAGYKQYETHTPNPYFVGFCGTSEAQCTADRFSSYYEMIGFDYYLTLKLTGFSCRVFFLTPGCETFRHYPLIFLIYNSGNDLTENNNNNNFHFFFHVYSWDSLLIIRW